MNKPIFVDLNGATFRINPPTRADNPFQQITLATPAEVNEAGFIVFSAKVIEAYVHKNQLKELAEAILTAIGLGE